MWWHLSVIPSCWQENQSSRQPTNKVPSKPWVTCTGRTCTCQLHTGTSWGWGRAGQPPRLRESVISNNNGKQIPCSRLIWTRATSASWTPMPSMMQGQFLDPVYVKVLWFCPETCLDELEKLVEKQRQTMGQVQFVFMVVPTKNNVTVTAL